MEAIMELIPVRNIKKETELRVAQVVEEVKTIDFDAIAGHSKQFSELTDSHINIIARNYYHDEAFSRNSNNAINLWNVFNLFTSANKSSYIDTFISRSVNATDFIFGLTEALNGKREYRWFIE